MCNAIAEHAGATNTKFTEENIMVGVANAQHRLVGELLNSFQLSYPNVQQIVDATAGVPAVVGERELQRFAENTVNYWPNGEYSLDRYRELLSELGVIGRVVSRKGHSPEIIEAAFDYSTPERLVIGRNEDSVIHPMFYRRLNITSSQAPRVLPFGPHLKELEAIVD